MFQFYGTEAMAQSNFFTSQGCSGCHAAPVVATCNGCHAHGSHPNSSKNSINVVGATNKTSYAPGETVSVTMTGGYRTGWFRAVLYDQNNLEVARSAGNASGMGSSTTYPAVLTAPAPLTPGTYTWKAAWYGNKYDAGGATFGAGWVADATNANHGEERVSTNSFTVASVTPPPVDTTAPVINTFTMPATASSLSVSVSSLIATDNVLVTGYKITENAVAPAASAAGWTASVPASVTASGAGAVTFYAWAKDAAGNVSSAASANVTITLPVADTTAPVINTFTMPATASSLTVSVSSFIATDNVVVTGYKITESPAAPAASAAGWSASVPVSVNALGTGDRIFYAWAKDASGNVSAGATATVTITVETPVFVLNVSTLADGSYTNQDTLNVSGTVIDTVAIKSVTVNNKKVTLLPDGSFTTALHLHRGNNIIRVVAIDIANNKKIDKRSIHFDPVTPHIRVIKPADNSSTAQSFITINGVVNELSTVTATVNGGSPQSAAMDGKKFNVTLNLEAGINTINITAVDLAGNTSQAKRTVVYDSVAPSLAVTSPDQDLTTEQRTLILTGTVADALGAVTVHVSINGNTHKVPVKDGVFQRKITFNAAKLYAITVTATDEAGNTSTVQRNVIYQHASKDNDSGANDGNN
jgi:hypothetical protein